MKKTLLVMAIGFCLLSCSDANDGDPTTDTTTTIPPDTSVLNSSPLDTAGTINTSTGTYSTDSSKNTNKKNDIRSSSSAYPDGRGIRENNKDSSRQ